MIYWHPSLSLLGLAWVQLLLSQLKTLLTGEWTPRDCKSFVEQRCPWDAGRRSAGPTLGPAEGRTPRTYAGQVT